MGSQVLHTNLLLCAKLGGKRLLKVKDQPECNYGVPVVSLLQKWHWALDCFPSFSPESAEVECVPRANAP